MWQIGKGTEATPSCGRWGRVTKALGRDGRYRSHGPARHDPEGPRWRVLRCRRRVRHVAGVPLDAGAVKDGGYGAGSGEQRFSPTQPRAPVEQSYYVSDELPKHRLDPSKRSPIITGSGFGASGLPQSLGSGHKVAVSPEFWGTARAAIVTYLR